MDFQRKSEVLHFLRDWSPGMNNPKRLASLLLTAVAVMALAACSGDATVTPGPTSAADSHQITSTTTPTAEVATSDPTGTDQAPGEPTSTREPESTPTSEASTNQIAKGPIAPALSGIAGWINTEPFAMTSLRGKVVLIDFWTYTCVNCIRTFPFLKQWHDKYAEHGLVIVGVHSPEFEFEKIRENVEAAAAQYDLKYPIVQDNAFVTWQAYRNRAWPSKYLIDKDGVIRYNHVGEGAYVTTEKKIRELLEEIGAPIAQIPLGTISSPNLDPQAITRGSSGQTRELYAGYLRNFNAQTPYVGNSDYYTTPVNTQALYYDPGDHENHVFYLQGLWSNGPESVTHARVTESLEDYVGLNFFGTTVNVVMDYEGDTPFRVVVTLAGEPIPEDFSGTDVQHDDDGTSFLLVDEPRMYRVVELPLFSSSELRLASNSDQFSVFAFTFGSNTEGP